MSRRKWDKMIQNETNGTEVYNSKAACNRTFREYAAFFVGIPTACRIKFN